MTDQEIIRQVQTIRRSSQADRIRRRTISMSGLARAAGISRMQLHAIASGQENIGPKSRAGLTQALMCKELGSVRS